MTKKSVNPKRVISIRKILTLFMVFTLLVFSATICVQETETKVDPEKWKKLTSEQKEKFKKDAKKARDTTRESVKTYNAGIKSREKGVIFKINVPPALKIKIPGTLWGDRHLLPPYAHPNHLSLSAPLYIIPFPGGISIMLEIPNF
jgi:hypothetical protein